MFIFMSVVSKVTELLQEEHRKNTLGVVEHIHNGQLFHLASQFFWVFFNRPSAVRLGLKM